MNFLKINCLKKNQKGFTLVEVLIAAGILGGVALVMLQLTKDQSTQSAKNKFNVDLAQFKTEVQTILQSPAHCQANFYNKTSGTSNPTSIYSCNTTTAGACRPGVPVSKFPVYTTDWNPTSTKISDRIRISGISMTISPAVTGTALSSATVVVSLQTRPNLSQTVSTNESVSISVPVVMTASTVIGCPKSFNSTLTY
jgi:prepilin-type N-terminal cleavage/methylation domain-containing protein